MSNKDPAQPKKADQKTVWISCRASPGCPGNQARIVRKFSLPTGGKSIHYKCSTCKNVFTVTL